MRSTPKTPRTLLFAIVTVTGASFLALLGIELYLRMTDFHYELRVSVIEATAPAAEQVHRAYVTDPYLIWVDKKYYGRLNEAKKRDIDIAFMGDSCTEYGNYDKHLSRRIENVTGREVGGVNLGVAGWTTHQGLNQMMRDVALLGPRVVTIYYGWNDHWMSIGLNDRQVELISSSLLGRIQRFRLGQLITKAYVGVASEKEKIVLRVGEAAFYENLKSMVEEARRVGAVPVLITAPSSHERGHEPSHLAKRWMPDLSLLVPTHQRYVGIVRRVAEEQNVVLCDLAREFGNLDKTTVRDKYFRSDGIHMTGEGDKKAAEFLFHCFEENDLLKISSH